MLSDLISSRSIQVGLAFFLLIVGGSLLYSWPVQRTTEVELTKRDRFLQKHEKRKNATHLGQSMNVLPETPGFIDTPKTPRTYN